MRSPEGQLCEIVARRVWLRRPFFRRGSRGLLCGWGLARSCGLGGSGGARNSQLFLGYIIIGMFSKIHLEIMYAFLGITNIFSKSQMTLAYYSGVCNDRWSCSCPRKLLHEPLTSMFPPAPLLRVLWLIHVLVVSRCRCDDIFLSCLNR